MEMNNYRKNRANSLNQTKSIINDVDLNKSTIGQSGNSDVDVNVNVIVDTTSIAFAYLCSMLATKKMTNNEFETAVQKLEELTHRHSKLNQNDLSNVKLYNQYNEKNQENKRQYNQYRRI
jgi:DNA gyrase/topoisomerase IV subunit A